MTERTKINRPITLQEVAVICAALERAPSDTVVPGLADSLGSLRAVGQCGCGCDSVDFVPHDPSHMSHPIADGTGKTPAGGDVGIIVWGHSDSVTGLEIYSLGADDHDLRLPVPESISPFTPDES